MRKIKIFLSVLIYFISASIGAQNKDIKAEAVYYFDQKDFKKAYELYDQLYTQVPKNMEYKFRLGYSALFYPEKKARAIELFEDIKRTDKSPDIDYYLAKSYHVNYRFNDAITSYEAFIAAKGDKIAKGDVSFIEDSNLGIQNCKNGNELISKKIIADIKNIGSPINTAETEGVPVISADESIMIYTYIGTKSTGGLLDDLLKPDKEEGAYHEDIFISTRD